MSEVRDEWDFYPCRVDDNPASIYLNLGYAEDAPIVSAPTLLWIGLEMLVPGDHGMGMEPDVDQLYEIEERIVAEMEGKGALYLGRLRNKGDWQLTFQGPKALTLLLDEIAVRGLTGQARGYRVGAEPDPDWSYYREFLFPDSERYQWILDRRVVDELRSHGDQLIAVRPVDHHLEFAPDAPVQSFVQAAAVLDFQVGREPAPMEDGAIAVHLVRPDPLANVQIHDAVMELTKLAREHGGSYAGWGCSVVSDG